MVEERMRDTRFAVEDGCYSIEVLVISSGPDVVLYLSGGDRPHVGAVSLASYVEGEDRVMARNLVAGHHKEDELTERVAKDIARELHCTAAVVAGIHYDELDRAGIDAICSLADEAGRRAVAVIRSEGGKE